MTKKPDHNDVIVSKVKDPHCNFRKKDVLVKNKLFSGHNS